MTLKRNIGKHSLLLASIAGMIGSGWLLVPFYAAKIAGPAAIFSWVIGGLLMLSIGYTFVILVTKIPISGGSVRYFQMTHGHFVGFAFSWIAWLAWISVAPIETLAILQYASNYLPWLMKVSHHSLSNYGLLVALGVMLVMYFINALGLKFLSKTNIPIVFFKLAIPITVVAVLLFHKFHTSNFTSIHGFFPLGIKSVFAALPTAGVVYALIGFNPAIQLAGEVKNPGKAISYAILGAISICTLLYILIQIVFIGVLEPSSFKHGWQHLTFIGDSGPFAGMLLALGMVWFVKLVYFGAIVSPFGTGLVQSAATGRLTYAMSLNNYFPKFLQKLNKHHSPARALAINTAIGLLFLLPFPSWYRMVGFLESCIVLGYVVGPMSLMVINAHASDHSSSSSKLKTELLCLIAFFACNLIIYWTGWSVIFKVFIAFVIGYAILFAFHLYKSDTDRLDLKIKYGWWFIIYILALTAISYLGSFGGGIDAIPFGWDFLVIAIFSVVVFYLAKMLANKEIHIAQDSLSIHPADM